MTHQQLKEKVFEKAEKLGIFESCFACTNDKCTAHKYNLQDRLNFLSNAMDEAARAAGEASRVEESIPKYSVSLPFYQDKNGQHSSSFNAAIAQSSRQLAEYFGELEASD